MRRPAGSGGGIVGQNHDGSSLIKLRDGLFGNVSAKFDRQMRGLCMRESTPSIPALVWWLAPATISRACGTFFKHQGEGLHQGFEPFIGSPMPDGENAVIGVATFCEIRRNRNRRKRSVSAQQHVSGGILRSPRCGSSREAAQKPNSPATMLSWPSQCRRGKDAHGWTPAAEKSTCSMMWCRVICV